MGGPPLQRSLSPVGWPAGLQCLRWASEQTASGWWRPVGGSGRLVVFASRAPVGCARPVFVRRRRVQGRRVMEFPPGPSRAGLWRSTPRQAAKKLPERETAPTEGRVAEGRGENAGPCLAGWGCGRGLRTEPLVGVTGLSAAGYSRQRNEGAYLSLASERAFVFTPNEMRLTTLVFIIRAGSAGSRPGPLLRSLASGRRRTHGRASIRSPQGPPALTPHEMRLTTLVSAS